MALCANPSRYRIEEAVLALDSDAWTVQAMEDEQVSDELLEKQVRALDQLVERLHACPPSIPSLSTRATETPSRAAARAAHTPGNPPPTTKTSVSDITGTSRPGVTYAFSGIASSLLYPF